MAITEGNLLFSYLFITGFIFMLIVTIIIFVITFQKRLQKNQIEMFNAVIHAQEKEQERIARDLHDEIGPALSIIKTQIQSFGDENLNDLDTEIKRDTIVQLQWTIKEIRTIAHNLIPATFTENGFPISLKHYISRLQEYNKIEVRFKCLNWPSGIDRGYELSIFRIIQELFQNTLKHAEASKIELAIQCDAKVISMVYKDNGKGFDMANKKHKKGIGFDNIESRIKLMGGTYTLQSKPDEGCCFNFSFPLLKLCQTQS